LDFTRYALQRAREQGAGAELLEGDVQALPFAAGSFDLVLSAHMLYHVPDIRAAAKEFRRVLRPQGTLAIIIGSARDQRELDELFLAAGGAFPLQRYSDRFTADNAPQYLAGTFTRVEGVEVHPQLVIPDAEALVACFESLRSLAEPALTPGVSWESFCDEVRHIADEEIARAGAFHVSEEIAMLVCR
jgi:SAM-dependent methyltransferase